MIYSAPSYLTGLVTEVKNEILAEIQKNYGNNTTSFKLNQKLTGLIVSWNEEFDEYGGRVWGTETNGNKLLLFDQLKHGYNGAMKLNEEDDTHSTKSIEFADGTEVILAFQYSGDEEEYLEEGASKLEQDYFGWIAIYTYEDNRLEEIISFECA